MLWRSNQSAGSSELCEICFQKFSQNAVQFDHKFLSDRPLEMISKEEVTLGSGGFFCLGFILKVCVSIRALSVA